MRFVRLTTLPDIQNRLREYTGKKINIVLRNRTVLSGPLIHLDQEQLTFEDMRGKKFSLSLREISEVHLDFKE